MTDRIIRDGKVVDDDWTTVADDAVLPSEGKIIVTWARWRAEAEALGARKAPLGVQFPSDENPADHPEVIKQLALVAIEFPKFADGRGYSYARRLRDRLGFTQEIRAVGDILRDQILYLWRCGFNAFAVRADRDPEKALAGLREFTVDYQPGMPRQAGDVGGC